MENASKALIIAGAILLSISIIGIGMFVFGQAQDAIGNTGLDSEKAQAYNQKFSNYFGNTVKGTQVKRLYDTVVNHNVTNQNDESLKVSINGLNTPTDLNAAKAKVQAGKTYKVDVTDGTGYDSGTGYIVAITIDPDPGK